MLETRRSIYNLESPSNRSVYQRSQQGEASVATSVGQPKILLTSNMHELARFATGEEAKDSYNRKCKIICTMGPKCWDVPTLKQLLESGMNVARLNFSHGDHETHGKTVEKIREAAKLANRTCAILLDTKGPEIRTGFLKNEDGVHLEKGREIILDVGVDYDTFKGDASRIAITYKKLATSVQPGNVILCADGVINLKVLSCDENAGQVKCEILNNSKLGQRKNVNLPGVHVDLPILQDKDKKDLVEFGIPHNVDFVAASFVQTAQDLKDIRSVLGEKGKHIQIISKIENEEGLKNFDAILEQTDGIMVARGDLGMEIPPEKVFIAQKMMIGKCNIKGKHVITATQMMESCITNPRPTRAEASDVANAVLDGTDCVMLSGETANGAFPVDTVRTMRRICEEAENVIDYQEVYLQMRLNALNGRMMEKTESLCSSAVKAALDMASPLILCLTATGNTARLIAKFRPPQCVMAITNSDRVARQLQVVRGVTPFLHDGENDMHTPQLLKRAVARAFELNIVQAGDQCVALHGEKEEGAGMTSLMKIVSVGENGSIAM